MMTNRKQRVQLSSEFQKIIFSDGLDEGLLMSKLMKIALLLGSPSTPPKVNSFGICVLLLGLASSNSMFQKMPRNMRIDHKRLVVLFPPFFKTLDEYGMDEFDMRLLNRGKERVEGQNIKGNG